MCALWVTLCLEGELKEVSVCAGCSVPVTKHVCVCACVCLCMFLAKCDFMCQCPSTCMHVSEPMCACSHTGACVDTWCLHTQAPPHPGAHVCSEGCVQRWRRPHP